jgi:predicted transcriptional regulator
VAEACLFISWFSILASPDGSVKCCILFEGGAEVTNVSVLKEYGNHHTYQHTQGLMLANFNKIAATMTISHAEYRLMCTLIGLWNKKHCMAFPTTDYLAKTCKMGKQTVIKSIQKLVQAGLIIVIKAKNKRNNYYFSNCLFNTISGSPVKPQDSIPCKTTHDHEQINKNLKEKNNLFLKNIYREEKETTTIEKKGEENTSNHLTTLINHKYWRHLPSGKVIQVQPDTGTHILFKMDIQNKTVTLFETNITDKISAFIPASKNEHVNANQSKPVKPDKKKIIKDLISNNKILEAKTVASMFRMSHIFEQFVLEKSSQIKSYPIKE